MSSSRRTGIPRKCVHSNRLDCQALARLRSQACCIALSRIMMGQLVVCLSWISRPRLSPCSGARRRPPGNGPLARSTYYLACPLPACLLSRPARLCFRRYPPVCAAHIHTPLGAHRTCPQHDCTHKTGFASLQFFTQDPSEPRGGAQLRLHFLCTLRYTTYCPPPMPCLTERGPVRSHISLAPQSAMLRTRGPAGRLHTLDCADQATNCDRLDPRRAAASPSKCGALSGADVRDWPTVCGLEAQRASAVTPGAWECAEPVLQPCTAALWPREHDRQCPDCLPARTRRRPPGYCTARGCSLPR